MSSIGIGTLSNLSNDIGTHMLNLNLVINHYSLYTKAILREDGLSAY